MARSIPQWLSSVLEQLELDRPELVTISDMDRIASGAGISVPGRVIASRLKDRGWLLETPQRGVWEFAPAEVAGAYSSADPLLPLKAFRLANPTIDCALSFQSAAWALGLADRVPARIEVAFCEQPKVKIPQSIDSSTYRTNLSSSQAKGVDVLPAEAVVIHMAQRPNAVRSWQSALEWLPDVAFEISAASLLKELEGRPASVYARTGYLLSGMRPDVSNAIAHVYKPRTKTRFGTTDKAQRSDELWQIVDSLLPFDPRKVGSVK